MTILYEQLLKKITNYQPDLNQLSSNINILNQDDTNMIFILIRIYSLRNKDVTTAFEIPYKGIKDSHYNDQKVYDITFNLTNFPDILVSILYNFVNLINTSIEYQRKDDNFKKSFLKKTKIIPIISLHNINFEKLDQEYMMNEIENFGTVSLSINQMNNTTRVSNIGIINNINTHEIINNVKHTKDNSVDANELHCGNCTLTISKEYKPVYLYNTNFCNFNCARAYANDYKKNADDIYNLYFKTFKKKCPIICPASDKCVLTQYGGNIDKDNVELYQKTFFYITQQNIIPQLQPTIIG